MKKEHKCPNCKSVDYVMYKCEICGKTEWFAKYTIIDEDLEENHLCSLKCMLKYILSELKKETPADGRFLYGNEDKTNESID